LFAKHFHIQVAVGLDPILVDLDGQSPNQSQAALLVGKDADDMGATLKLLINPRQSGAFDGQSSLLLRLRPCYRTSDFR
jgi:hypothetical protein